MKIIISEKCGFCFGVEHAIELAEEMLAQRKVVYCLGSIIHNKQVVDRLAERGLKVVEDLREIPSTPAGAPEEDIPTVLIRSHGCHPDTLAEIARRGLRLADATCILVKRAQKLVRELHEQGYKVVIIGDPDHPEVQGAVGYAPGVTVVADESDLARLPVGGKLAVVSQTTHSPADFIRLVGLIAARGFDELRVINTICRETARRQEAAVALCARVDVMFVLGGRNSANTGELAQLCRRQGVTTHLLESSVDFDPVTIVGVKTVGVTAGASTPEWIIRDFVARLNEASDESAQAKP